MAWENSYGDEFPDGEDDEWCDINDCRPWRKYTHVGTYAIDAATFRARRDGGDYCLQGTLPRVNRGSRLADTSFKDPNKPPTYEQMLANANAWRTPTSLGQITQDDTYDYLLQYYGGNIDQSDNDLGGYQYNLVYPDYYYNDDGSRHEIPAPQYLGGEWKWYEYYVASAFRVYKRCTITCPEGSSWNSSECIALPGWEWDEESGKFVEQDGCCDEDEAIIYLSTVGSTISGFNIPSSVVMPKGVHEISFEIDINAEKNGSIIIQTDSIDNINCSAHEINVTGCSGVPTIPYEPASCCDYMPKDFVDWKRGIGVPSIIPYNKR